MRLMFSSLRPIVYGERMHYLILINWYGAKLSVSSCPAETCYKCILKDTELSVLRRCAQEHGKQTLRSALSALQPPCNQYKWTATEETVSGATIESWSDTVYRGIEDVMGFERKPCDPAT